MDRRTLRVYERHAEQWIHAREGGRGRRSRDASRRVGRLAGKLRRGARVADLGCGPGWHGDLLRARGFRVVGLDLSSRMLRAARSRSPHAPLVRADLARLPFARESLDGVWARNTYMHLPLAQLPAALAELQRVLRPGARVAVSLGNLEVLLPTARERKRGWVERRGGESKFSGRLFVGRDAQGWRDLFEGAGFDRIKVEPGHEPFWLWVQARRPRGLADAIAPRLRLLVCGLNPSPLAAATGIPFAGPNNRFWPAALRAGLVLRERDLAHALERGIGFTDLVKRPTPGASALARVEYARGAERLRRLVASFEPRALVFVGLDGFRRAIDARAQPGPIPGGFAGRPAYLMPSTSGRNAATPLASLARHLRRALDLTPARRTR